jgi:hypothetical protein
MCQDVIAGEHRIFSWVHQRLYLLLLTWVVQHWVQAASRCTQ